MCVTSGMRWHLMNGESSFSQSTLTEGQLDLSAPARRMIKTESLGSEVNLQPSPNRPGRRTQSKIQRAERKCLGNRKHLKSGLQGRIRICKCLIRLMRSYIHSCLCFWYSEEGVMLRTTQWIVVDRLCDGW